MTRRAAVKAEAVSLNVAWRRRRKGSGNVQRLRRFVGSVETGSKAVFSNLDLEIESGSFVCVKVAASGDDKLLGLLLSGKVPPDSGTVRRSGHWILSPGGRILLGPGLTVRQNVNLVSGLLGYPGPLPESIESAIVESLSAGNMRHRPTDQAPPAMMRRLTTIAALHLPADVYCLVGNLRTDFQSDRPMLQHAIHERIANGATVIAISQKPPGIPVDRVIDVVTQQRGQ